MQLIAFVTDRGSITCILAFGEPTKAPHAVQGEAGATKRVTDACEQLRILDDRLEEAQAAIEVAHAEIKRLKSVIGGHERRFELQVARKLADRRVELAGEIQTALEGLSGLFQEFRAVVQGYWSTHEKPKPATDLDLASTIAGGQPVVWRGGRDGPEDR